MTEAATVQFEAQHITDTDVGWPAESTVWHSHCDLPRRKKLTLNEVKAVLQQEPVIFSHLINGTSPFGADFPLAATWKQDGEALAMEVMNHLNALKDDENGLTLVISCAGAYQQGRMDHLMIWNISVADGMPKLQIGNHESIGSKHYPTEKIDTVELWKKIDPTGRMNSNAPGTPVDTFEKTPLGISVAKYGLFINLFPAIASENFEAAMETLNVTEAGQNYGVFDGKKTCFTTARDLLGAIRTKGPQGTVIDWEPGKPEPVAPVIMNKLCPIINAEPIGVVTALGRTWDFHDKNTRLEISANKAVYAAMIAKLGNWISQKPGAYMVTIRPALHSL